MTRLRTGIFFACSLAYFVSVIAEITYFDSVQPVCRAYPIHPLIAKSYLLYNLEQWCVTGVEYWPGGSAQFAGVSDIDPSEIAGGNIRRWRRPAVQCECVRRIELSPSVWAVRDPPQLRCKPRPDVFEHIPNIPQQGWNMDHVERAEALRRTDPGLFSGGVCQLYCKCPGAEERLQPMMSAASKRLSLSRSEEGKARHDFQKGEIGKQCSMQCMSYKDCEGVRQRGTCGSQVACYTRKRINGDHFGYETGRCLGNAHGTLGGRSVRDEDTKLCLCNNTYVGEGCCSGSWVDGSGQAVLHGPD